MVLVSRLPGTSFLKVTLVMWLLTMVFALLILSKIDGIVHEELYNYGLRFDYNWAIGYWTLLRLLYVCLAVPSVLSIIALGSSLRRVNGGQSAKVSAVKPSNSRVPVPRTNSMVISCPNCQKMFIEPLTMLDFSTGKATLVNVCPYCNHILGRTDKKKPDDIEVLEPERKEVQ